LAAKCASAAINFSSLMEVPQVLPVLVTLAVLTKELSGVAMAADAPRRAITVEANMVWEQQRKVTMRTSCYGRPNQH
jgi:hypothetical protein